MLTDQELQRLCNLGHEDAAEEIAGLRHYKRMAEIYAAERDHARARYDQTVRILTGIHALLYPPRFTDNDGRTWQFKSPLIEEQMQELSDRIRALPDEIAAIDATMKPPNASGNQTARQGRSG